ncbi:DUF1232 domain-containing protein [Crenobacter sp. SG2303]|uniref:DUF1232 domain-containing protein n=1 Tax=Crenobacter oryzisoli TaxID=3056844 RepID=A0ABT7XKA5_9NEIS|nr:DUF1232 domain-containing protein [Crenobacter sp. SG2303]MDN0074004.1 DUF1232 domain-containing protein [Crenobacter sp. SG2303]
MALFRKLGGWAGLIRLDIVTLAFAFRHPATPWYVRGLCLLGVAYLLSPVNLASYFIPLVGMIDDALIVAGVIWLALRLMPAQAREESQVRAKAWLARFKTWLRNGALVVVLYVLVFGGGLLYLLWHLLGS